MLSFWPGPGVNLLAGAGAGVFPPANAYFWPGVVILAGAGTGAGAPVDHCKFGTYKFAKTCTDYPSYRQILSRGTVRYRKSNSSFNCPYLCTEIKNFITSCLNLKEVKSYRGCKPQNMQGYFEITRTLYVCTFFIEVVSKTRT